MKLGVSAFAWTARFEPSRLHLLTVVREMGFRAFEIAMFNPADLAVNQIRRAYEDSELECTVCAILPAGINPISPDPSTRRKSGEHLVRCIETASELGAKIIAGPLYAPIGYLPDHRPTAEEWSRAVEAFQRVGELLDSCQVTLAIEPVNRSETFFLRTAREAKSLCEDIDHPRIGVTLDTFHANIEERNVAAAITSLGGSLKHLHASENDRGLLGTGHIDFPGIIDALARNDYDGYLMIEGFGYSPHELNAPGALWADIANSPEDIALKGAHYLRSLLDDQNIGSF